LCLAALLAGAASAQTVRLTWIGQACFVLQSEGGPTVITDPPAANIGYPLPQLPADVVTVTHDHGDHNFTAGVRGTFTVVDGRTAIERTEMTAANLPFVLIPGFHDNQNGAMRGRNTLIQWTQSGLRFAHFGDIGQEELNAAQLADLQNLDVLFIPAGGFFTVDAARAAALVSQLQPRVTVLMHYRTALGGPAQLAGVPAVGAPFGSIRYQPSSVVIGRDRLPASREVWVMEPAADSAVVNAADSAGGYPLAPGGLASLYGAFTGSQTAAASQLPLPRRLGETEVVIQGNAVPLLYASPDQINLQVPGARGRPVSGGGAGRGPARRAHLLDSSTLGASHLRGGQSGWPRQLR
jgi:L-ascorbate metabolism protein UlaG (beta-lactamase superfamily)